MFLLLCKGSTCACARHTLVASWDSMGCLFFFSFGLTQKKQKFKAARILLKSVCIPLKGLKLASLRQSPLLNAPFRLISSRKIHEASLSSAIWLVFQYALFNRTFSSFLWLEPKETFAFGSLQTYF